MNIATIAIAFKKRMILYAVLSTSFLYLVTGQAFQIQDDLQRSHTTTYLLNFINDVGFDTALWYVFGVSLVSLFLALFAEGYRRHSQHKQFYSFAPSSGFYVGLFLFQALLAGVLIFVVVGLSTFLQSSRPGFETGATVFLILLFVGVIPLLLKILLSSKIVRGDVACCLFSFLVTGAFSRTDLIMYLLAILLALFYVRGWADEDITPRRIAIFGGFGLTVGVIIAGIGALHDAQNFIQGSLGDLVGYIVEHPEKSIISMEYNYRLGIEGMSGIAGAFTQAINNPASVHHDFGASWIINGGILSLPGVLKTYASGIAEIGAELNWYPWSIVPSGAESFATSFGWSAIGLYPAAVFLFSWYLPLRLQQSRLSPKGTLIGYSLMICTVFLVHGPLAIWIAFSFSFTVVTLLFWPALKPHIKVVAS
jgi:hypothetical protein